MAVILTNFALFHNIRGVCNVAAHKVFENVLQVVVAVALVTSPLTSAAEEVTKVLKAKAGPRLVTGCKDLRRKEIHIMNLPTSQQHERP